MTSERTLTTREAYLAMFAFLEEYYAQTAYEQIGVLLGELKLNSDGIPGDPAAWDDWLISIEKVLVRE